MISAFFTGLVTAGGLIIAVGAQNAFLLEQAIKRHYAFTLAIMFILSDMLSITLGTYGLGVIIQQVPELLEISRYAGVLFLLYISYSKIKASFQDSSLLLERAQLSASFSAIIVMGAAVTWLNPHFYLDTMILMASLANQWQEQKVWFVLGCFSAAVIWFFSIVLIGKALNPYMKSSTFWRWLNRVNGTVILLIALQIYTMPL